MTNRKEETPYFCANCGKDKQLIFRNQKFYYRTILGWIGLVFGITYQFIWDVKMYFCGDCIAKLNRNALISRWSFFCGILLLGIFIYFAIMSFPDFEKSLLFFSLSALSVIAGFLGRAIFQMLGTPKVAEISRRQLVVKIPHYGNFDFVKGISLER